MKDLVVAFFIVLAVSSAFKWPQNDEAPAQSPASPTPERQERVFQ